MRTVDVRRLAREKLLYDGASCGWKWWDDSGKQTASIWIRVEGGAVGFDYRLNGEHDVNDRARLVSTGCNYGGARQWFACPCCGGRCAVLSFPLFFAFQRSRIMQPAFLSVEP